MCTLLQITQTYLWAAKMQAQLRIYLDLETQLDNFALQNDFSTFLLSVWAPSGIGQELVTIFRWCQVIKAVQNYV